MREILFRAWDKVSKKYREFDGMHDTMTINKDGKVEYYNLQNGSGGDEYILEQFTGRLILGVLLDQFALHGKGEDGFFQLCHIFFDAVERVKVGEEKVTRSREVAKG